MGTPLKQRLVLIGGGFNHANILLHWSQFGRPNNFDIELINPETTLAHPALLSGLLSGCCRSGDAAINLPHLCTRASCRFIESDIESFDADCGSLALSNNQTVESDLISIDLGGLIARKPFPSRRLLHSYNGSDCYRQWQHLLAQLSNSNQAHSSSEQNIAVLGDSVEAIEIALAIASSRVSQLQFNIHLLYSSEHLLQSARFLQQQYLRQKLQTSAVTLHPNFQRQSYSDIDDEVVINGQDRSFSCDAAIDCGAAPTPNWLLRDQQQINAMEFESSQTRLLHQPESKCPILIHGQSSYHYWNRADTRRQIDNIERAARGQPLATQAAGKRQRRIIYTGQNQGALATAVGIYEHSLLHRWQQWRDKREVQRFNR